MNAVNISYLLLSYSILLSLYLIYKEYDKRKRENIKDAMNLTDEEYTLLILQFQNGVLNQFNSNDDFIELVGGESKVLDVVSAYNAILGTWVMTNEDLFFESKVVKDLTTTILHTSMANIKNKEV